MWWTENCTWGPTTRQFSTNEACSPKGRALLRYKVSDIFILNFIFIRGHLNDQHWDRFQCLVVEPVSILFSWTWLGMRLNIGYKTRFFKNKVLNKFLFRISIYFQKYKFESKLKARDALRDLYPDLQGSVYLAPIGVARRVAVISNRDTFFTRTLPMLNQRALNPSKTLNTNLAFHII